MESQLRTDDAEPDPMLPEQFEMALAETQIRTPKLIAVCRAVLVDGVAAPEIAQQHDVDVSRVYRATSTIRDKWKQICTEREWEYLPLAFPKSIMRVMLEFERELLRNDADRKGKRRARKEK
jgi:hypothetical protein